MHSSMIILKKLHFSRRTFANKEQKEWHSHELGKRGHWMEVNEKEPFHSEFVWPNFHLKMWLTTNFEILNLSNKLTYICFPRGKQKGLSCHKNVSLFRRNLTKSGIDYDRKIMKIFSVVNHLEWFLCYTVNLPAKGVTMLLFLLVGIWLFFQRLLINTNNLSIMLIIHNKFYHTNGFPVIKIF